MSWEQTETQLLLIMPLSVYVILYMINRIGKTVYPYNIQILPDFVFYPARYESTLCKQRCSASLERFQI